MNKEILNMEEAAEFFNVSVKTFIKLLKEEKVPARKIGREWRFSSEALVQWLASGDSQQYSSSESDAREFFDKVAPEWDAIRGGYYDDEVVGRLTESGLLKNDAMLIDIGTGDGYLARSAATKVNKVLAVDISGEMLKTLINKAQESGIKNIETIESDGCDMPIEDESADVICANMFLHHIEQPLLAIREMYRVLKPGGKAFLADLREHGNLDFKNKMHDTWPGFSQREVKGWFEKCGFKNIKVEIINKKPSAKKADEGIFIVIAEK